MTFVHPLALLGLAGVAALAIAAGRHGALDGRRRAWLGAGLAAPVLVVLALAAPELRSGAPRPTVLAVDASASIGAAGRAIERAWIARLRAGECPAPCRIVRFAGAARAAVPGAAPAAAPGGAGETDLATAIGDAAGLAPPGGRVVVLSDGGATEGDIGLAAARARSRAVAVDWVRLPGAAAGVRDAAITAIAMPAAVRLGDTVPLTLTVWSTVAADATLRLSADGGPARSETIALRRGDNPLLLLYTAERRGRHSFAARVAMRGDALAADDAGAAVVDVLAAPRVLLAGGTALRRPLAARGLDVRSVAPAQLPSSAGGYGGDAAVILDDVPAAALAPAQVAALGDAVRRGGLGLLVAGGPHSLSLGRYATSPLQALLPVASLVPGRLQRRNVAIELVLDHSGSMIDPSGGAPKIVMTHVAARDTAAFAAAHEDELGIVDFDIAAHTLVPLRRLTSPAAERRVDDTVDRLQADGGTDIYAGLQAGLAAIRHSAAPQHHIVLMTDGISQPQDFAPLLARLRRARVTVATVALGSDADRGLLARIAKGTGGRAYVTDNARALPRIFAREDQLSAKPVTVRGRLAVAAGADSPVVRSLAGRPLPPLSGNVVTTLKRGAQADLVASGAGGRVDPALAEWQLGAGRVVVWTAGSGGPWARSWGALAGPLWNDAVRWAGRAPAAPALTPRVMPGRPGVLELDLAPLGAAGELVRRVSGSLAGPGGHARALRFRLAGPGVFTAAIGTPAAGVYRFRIAAAGAGAAAGEIALPGPAERSPVTPAISPLGAVVSQTGGAMIAPGRPDALAARATALQRPLALAALVAFLVALAGRMGALPSRWRRRTRAGPPSGRPAPAATQRSRARSNSSERALSSSSSSASADVDAAT